MIEKKNIKVNPKLLDFIDNEVLKDLNINLENFWNGFSDIVDVYFPQNINLLAKRRNLQDKINNWHKKNKSKDFNLDEYKKFLIDINYIVKEGPEFKIRTSIAVAMELIIKTKRKNHQYSDRDALPEKVLYFEKHIFIDSIKFIC